MTVLVLEVLGVFLHGLTALVLVAAGAAASQQTVDGPEAGRRRHVPVPVALEHRQLRPGVEVLPSARLVTVRLVSVLDQHFLQCDKRQWYMGAGRVFIWLVPFPSHRFRKRRAVSER